MTGHLTMRSVRALRTGTAAAVIAWKRAALAALPAAFCCQAVLDAGGGGRPCCEGKDHGDSCPLNRTARSGASDGPRMQTRADAQPFSTRPRRRLGSQHAHPVALHGAVERRSGLAELFPLAFGFRRDQRQGVCRH